MQIVGGEKIKWFWRSIVTLLGLGPSPWHKVLEGEGRLGRGKPPYDGDYSDDGEDDSSFDDDGDDDEESDCNDGEHDYEAEYLCDEAGSTDWWSSFLACLVFCVSYLL